MLHENENINTNQLMPEEGQLRISCSNEVLKSCPPFDIKNQSEPTIDELLEILADIIVEDYFDKQ